jgi:hypothetical protein
MQAKHSQTHHHGYPTPPHSPDSLTSSPTQSPDLAPSSPPRSKSNDLRAFDPLEGYTQHHHDHQQPTRKGMSTAIGHTSLSGAGGGSSGATTASKRRPSSSSAGGGGGGRRRSPGGTFNSSEGDDAGWDAEEEFSPPRRAGSGAGRGRRNGGGGPEVKERYPPKDPELFSDTDDEWHVRFLPVFFVLSYVLVLLRWTTSQDRSI